MPNKINLLRFLIVVLFLSTIAIATETTWRHSGFEISGYDISGISTYNLTEIRKIEFGWNTSIPAVSETSRAVMYYDDNQKRIMQSLNGGAYQAIVDNTTVNFYTGNATNLTNGTIDKSRMPANVSYNYTTTIIIDNGTTGIEQTISASTFTRLNLTREIIDSKNEYSQNNFTVTDTGNYVVFGSANWGVSNVNERHILTVYVNGVETSRLVDSYVVVAGVADTTRSSDLLRLNSSDIVSLFVFTDTQRVVRGYSDSTYFKIKREQ